MNDPRIRDWEKQSKDFTDKRKKNWIECLRPRLQDLADQHYLSIERRDIRFLKEYYINGRRLPYDEKWLSKVYVPQREKDMLGRAYEPSLVFQVWFHPGDESDIKKLIDNHFCLSDDPAYEVHQFWLGYNKLPSYWISTNDSYEFLNSRSQYLEKYAAPKTWLEALGPRPSEDRVGKSVERQRQFWDSQKKRHYYVMWQILRAMKDIYGGRQVIFAFCFDLLRDLSLLVDYEKAYEAQGNEFNFRNLISEVHKSLLTYDGELPDINAKLVIDFVREAREFFDGGVSTEIDRSWKKAKSKFGG